MFYIQVNDRDEWIARNKMQSGTAHWFTFSLEKAAGWKTERGVKAFLRKHISLHKHKPKIVWIGDAT